MPLCPSSCLDQPPLAQPLLDFVRRAFGEDYKEISSVPTVCVAGSWQGRLGGGACHPRLGFAAGMTIDALC